MSRYESLIEQQIRLAQERGEFDNLPGAGRPAPGAGPSSAPGNAAAYVRQLDGGMPREHLMRVGTS
jgi:hypothetical protein